MKRGLITALVAALALAALPTFASTFIHMPQHDLVAQADSVIHGRVIDVNTFWSDSGRIIITEATIKVDDVLVGNADSTVVVRTFGGQIGDIRAEAHGFPTFKMGENVLLFLQAEEADNSIRVLGYQEGQFRVVTRNDGVTLAVPMVDEDARYVTRDGKVSPARRSIEINQFKAQIRDLAEQNGRRAIVR